MSNASLIWMTIAGIFVAGLMVFSICYFLLKQFFNNRIVLEQLAIQQQSIDKTLPLKLQAYERLTLLFEADPCTNVDCKVQTA